MPPALRALRAIGLLLLVLWVAVRAAIWAWPPSREAWSLLSIGPDQAVLLARLSVSDSGFYRDQLTTRVYLLRPDGGVFEHRAMYAPTKIREDGVASGLDSLEATAEGWELRVAGDGAQARAVLRGARPGCPGEAGELQGVMGTSVEGEGGDFGGERLEGRAVVIRTRAEGHVRGKALYVLGPDVVIVVEPLAVGCTAWGVVGGESWAGVAPVVEGAQGSLTVGPWQLELRPTATRVDSGAWPHLLGPERWLAAAVGQPEPTLRVQRLVVEVQRAGARLRSSAILLVRGE